MRGNKWCIVNAKALGACSEQVKRRYHVGIFFKCARFWSRNQNPTFIGREKYGDLRGYCGDRKSEQVCWVMGRAQGLAKTRGWSKGLLSVGQWVMDKGKG